MELLNTQDGLPKWKVKTGYSSKLASSELFLKEDEECKVRF